LLLRLLLSLLLSLWLQVWLPRAASLQLRRHFLWPQVHSTER
jgi:hypothetical protein